MLQAGVEVLAEHGVEIEISSISYARVFEHLERTHGVRVTYGSVHERIWNSVQEYQLAVIERAGVWNPSPAATLPATHAATPAERPRAVQDAWRRFALTSRTSAGSDPNWTRWLRSIVALSTQPDGGVVRSAARDGARASYERLEAMVRDNLTAGIGGGFEPGEVFPDDADVATALARVAIALAEGLDLRATLTGDVDPVLRLHTGPDGELEEWNAYGFAVWAIVAAHFDARRD